MFPNCLLLDLTVIDLLSLVHMDKTWVEIAKKNLKCGRPGGGGSSVISDTPGRGGGGGSKKGKFLRTSFKLFQHYIYNKFIEFREQCQ